MEKTFKDNERGVLFDFNGTLLFDTPLHCEAWKRISEEIWDPLQCHNRRVYGFHLCQQVRGGAASGDGQ